LFQPLKDKSMNSLSKTLLGAVFALIAVFFAVPMVAGGSTDVCQDVELHNVKTIALTITGTDSGMMYNVINSAGQAGATGEVERQKQEATHPYLPTVLSCAAAFWHSL
jgi:hypothetical protein